jgi:DNA-binding NtrC family response regulator
MAMKSFLRKLFPAKEFPPDNAKTILIVDDDESMRDSLKDVLEGEGYETCQASTRAEALEVAEEVKPKVALVDLKLPDGLGTVLLAELKQTAPDCQCILITAYADVDSAIQALERGVFYYLRKPVRPHELVELVDMAFETIRLREEKTRTEEELRQRNKELEEIVERLKTLSD